MEQRPSHRVHRVPVTDPLVAGRPYDYADAFAAELAEPDPDPPEAWVRAGMASTPALVDWIAARLGHQDAAPGPSPEVVEGFRVVQSTPEVLQLEQSLPLLDVVLIARRTGPRGRVLTSVLTYRRPLLARLVWSVVRHGHRWAVRGLITGSSELPATRTGTRGPEVRDRSAG